MEQKKTNKQPNKTEEDIENNVAFVYRSSKNICNRINTKSIFFEIRHIRPKYVYLLFQFFVYFGLFIKPNDKTDSVSEQFCKKKWVAVSKVDCLSNSPLFEGSDDYCNDRVSEYSQFHEILRNSAIMMLDSIFL